MDRISSAALRCVSRLERGLRKRVIREGLKPFLERNIAAWDMTRRPVQAPQGVPPQECEPPIPAAEMLAGKPAGLTYPRSSPLPPRRAPFLK